ncbi:electron transfer flavoprotein subunit alpha/FixB family protein [Mycoplasmatota bacterium]|nr:electron transfer flavoprotein subunit alpha/FixB family protein [Mycoplasmatota bacterium]
MRTCAVFVEQRHGKVCSVGLELISEAKRNLGDRVTITAIYAAGAASKEDLKAMSSCGAHEIITILDKKLEDYDTTYYADALTQVIQANDFDVLLIGSTLLGRDLGPRLSARLDTGLTADATVLEFEESEEKLDLFATRPALGGNLFATIICPNTRPQMATVRPGVFSISVDAKNEAKVMDFKASFEKQSKVKILDIKAAGSKHVDLTKAKLIISGGRGVATMFQTMKDIAEITGGEVAASRAVVDSNIQPKDRLVGQTGSTVRPSVYVASGISGAIQHIAGMDKSELIIAINTDPNALIFNIADVSIIADANKVLPLLKEEVAAIKALHQ